MAKPRRNVQFQHRVSNHHNGRRPSISESEGVSEPGSPIRASLNGKLETSKEEVKFLRRCITFALTGPISSANADAHVCRMRPKLHRSQSTKRKSRPSSHGQYGPLS